MKGSDISTAGMRNARPGREAVTGGGGHKGGGHHRRDDMSVVPAAKPTSYYGLPVLNRPVWKSPDIPGYLFLGGLAGVGSVLAAGAQATGRPALARRVKVGAVAAIALGAGGLVHDLGRPSRAANMLRVLKPTSPMSVGSWLLAAYGPAAAVAAASDVTGVLPAVGAAASGGAALLGPAVASYTGALLADTAVPAWHDGYRELPFLFAASAATAAGGLGLVTAPIRENAPALRLGVLGAIGELAALKAIERREGPIADPYRKGRGGAYVRAGELLATSGAVGAAVLGRRGRIWAAASGVALMAGSAATRWGVFHAGLASADDPSQTIGPQRRRLAESAT